MTAEAARDTERLSSRAARFVLAFAYLCLAGLYAWQASKRLSPTIFSDEIEFTHISRAIAQSGVPSQRGDPSGFETLYTYVVAPAWWIDDTQQAWEMAKLIGVLVMTAAIFPAYALARFVASRPWALAAAIASVAAPPLAYAPYLLDEPLAYPIATTALWAIAAATAHPSRRRLGVAAGLCVLAPLVRGELAVLLVVFAASVFTLLWRTERFRGWRRTWTVGDWLGVALLTVGVAVVASAAAGHRSEPWYQATAFLKHRMFNHGLWALAAMFIGIGVLPIVGTVAAFLSGRVRATDEGRAFVTVGVVAFVVFVGYAAVKAAYLTLVLGDLIVERNVIYLVPVAFAATAAVLARPIATIPALAAGLVLSLFLVMHAEFRLDNAYFEAPGLAITALANRNFSWDGIDIEHALIVAAVVSVAILVARSFVASRALGLGVAVVAACAVASWSLTTEVYAARGLNDFSARLYGSTPRPVDWVDEATGGEPALYLGQQIKDHESDLAARVLEPLGRADLEPRRERRCAVSLARSRRPRRHDQPGSGCRVGRRRQRRRRPGRARGRAAWKQHAHPRHAAGPPPLRPDRRLRRRLDGSPRQLLAIRAGRRCLARVRPHRPVTTGGLWCERPDGEGRRPRGQSRRSQQATGHGTRVRRRPPDARTVLAQGCGGARDRPLPRGRDRVSDVRPEQDRRLERRRP